MLAAAAHLSVGLVPVPRDFAAPIQWCDRLGCCECQLTGLKLGRCWLLRASIQLIPAACGSSPVARRRVASPENLELPLLTHLIFVGRDDVPSERAVRMELGQEALDLAVDEKVLRDAGEHFWIDRMQCLWVVKHRQTF